MSSAGASILARRLPAAADLPALVAALRPAGRPEPVAGDRPGVADAVAAAAGQLRGDARRRRGALRSTTAEEAAISAEHVPRARNSPSSAAAAPRRRPADGHATHVAHHFRDMPQQHEAGMLGMWMFLGTEVLFFGGVLTAFTVYRWKYPDAFTHASMLLYYSDRHGQHGRVAVQQPDDGDGRPRRQDRPKPPGVAGVPRGHVRPRPAFLVVKGVEYTLDYREHLIPNLDFHPKTGEGADEWPPSLDLNQGQIFFSFYFVLTAIHGVHMLIGLALVVILIVLAGRGRYGPAHYTPVEAIGLYWHFVEHRFGCFCTRCST